MPPFLKGEQMTKPVINYQCPSCTGPLHFVGSSQMLECDYCSTKYTIEEIEKYYHTEHTTTIENKEWDISMKAYSCPSCGAEVICDEHTVATCCPYCSNPNIILGKFENEKQPDYVIPFVYSHEDAKNALKEYYADKKFLPKEFTEENKIEKIQGVYVPFYLFDATVDVDASFVGTRSMSHRERDFIIKETSYYDVYRQGRVPFVHIPQDASVNMPDTHMDAIEPFDYTKIQPFSTAYLPGFLAEKQSVPSNDCLQKVQERAKNTAIEVIRQNVNGYESLMVKQQNIDYQQDAIHYALLPVYLLSTTYKNENYLFAMNGQTGKFVGNLPISQSKYWKHFIVVAISVTLVTAILFFITMGGI